MTTATPSRSQITADMTASLLAYLRNDPETFKAWEQGGARAGRHGERADVCRVCHNGCFEVYEVKSCGADFDADELKRHTVEPWRAMGNRRYYVCFRGVIDRPPADYGLIYWHCGDDFREVIEPVINDRPSVVAERAMKAAVMTAWMAESRSSASDPLPPSPGGARRRQTAFDLLAALLVDGLPWKLTEAKRSVGFKGSNDNFRRAVLRDERFVYDAGSVMLA